MRASGALVRLAVGFEPSYGTPPDYEKFWRMPFVSSSLGSEQALTSESVFGDGRDATALGQDALVVDGDVVVPLDGRFIGIWLKALFGEPVTTGVEAPWTHRFSSGAWALPSLTVELAMQDILRFATYAGVVANTLTLQMQRGGAARGTVGLVAKTEAVESYSLLLDPAEMDVLAFPNWRGEVLRNGDRLGDLQSAQLTYSNNLGRRETIREWGEIDGADPSFATLTGRLEARFSDDALYQQAIDGGACELRFEWVMGNFSLRFIAHEVHLSRPRLPVQGPRGIQASFDWHGVRDASEGLMATVLLNTDMEVIDIVPEGLDPWDQPYTLGSSWSVPVDMPAGYSLVSLEQSRAQDRFVAVSEVGASQDALVSRDGGETWEEATTQASTQARRGVAFSDFLGLFVTGRDYSTGKQVLLSPDGFAWTAQTVTASPTTHHNELAWSPALGLFVLVGDGGALLRSLDGLTWTNIVHGFGSKALYDVCWSPDLALFVVVGEDGTIYTSPDAVTWTDRSVGGTAELYSVCWSAELGIFVAGSQSKLWTSPDGVAWTARTPSAVTGRNVVDLIWVRQLAKFIGMVDAASAQSVCIVSVDGIAWTTRAMPTALHWQAVAWDGLRGRLVAVASQSSPWAGTDIIAVMQCAAA